MEGGPGQPLAPNVPAAAMKSILPEVRRQEEGKGGRGQPKAGAAGSGDSSVSAGGRGRTGKGGKGQAVTSGAVHAKGHQAGKEGKASGRQGGLEGSGAQRAAQWWDAEGGRAGGTEQRSGAGQGCGICRRRQGQAGERSEARRAPGEGTWEGGTPRSRRQGTRGDGATRQRAGEGEWPWVHGLAGVPREGIGLVGRCSPASRPTNRSTIPAATIPGEGDDVPTPAGVPGHAATGTRAAAPAGRWDSVGGAGREGRRAQKGEAKRSLREREASIKEWAGGAEEGRTGGTNRPQGGEAQEVEELQRAWADLRRRQGGFKGRNGIEDDKRREGGGRVPHWCRSSSRLSRRSRRERCRRGHGGGSGERRRSWQKGTGRWRRESAGCGRRRGRWPGGPTGSSRIRKGTPPPRM